MRALRTIRAILRAAPRFNRDQLAFLYSIRGMKLAVDGLRLKNQLGQRRPVNRRYLVLRPIVPELRLRGSLLGRAG
jgi:hypothetical protein